MDEIIKQLISRLPSAGSVWPQHKRAHWLRAMSSCFDLVYVEEQETFRIEGPVQSVPVTVATPVVVIETPHEKQETLREPVGRVSVVAEKKLASAGPNLADFEHKGRTASLDQKEYRVAVKLHASLGRGFLDFKFLAQAALMNEWSTKTDSKSVLSNIMATLNPKLNAVGLNAEKVPNMGYVLKEIG